MNILDWINVGKVSAERDDLLSQYFYDNGVLKSVIESPTSFLVLGRKGAGKTAVFKELKENANKYIGEENVLTALSFEDYKWNIHSLLKNSEAAESLAYKQSWRFIILIESVKAYTSYYKKTNKPLPKSLNRCSELLRKLFDDPIPNIYSIIGRKLLKLSKLKLPSGGVDLDGGNLDSIEVSAGDVSFEDVKDNSTLQSSLSQNIDNVISFVETELRNLESCSCRVFLAFDRIDEAWDPMSVEVSKRVIAGLVSAAEAITTRYNGAIRPIVFLREDIFEVLPINDMNKLREDCGSLLKWDKDSLFRLLLMRINYFAKLKDIPEYTDIDTLFEKTEMRQRTKPSSYLLKRSMMRPRDLICLFDRIINITRDIAKDPFTDAPLELQTLPVNSIYNAESGYSDWLKKELIDEWAVQYPSIKKLLDAVQNHGLTNFTKYELRASIQKSDSAPTDSELSNFIRFLFDNSIVGFRIGGSSLWKYKCFYPSQGFIEAEDYKMHDGLIRGLNLKEPRGREPGKDTAGAE